MARTASAKCPGVPKRTSACTRAVGETLSNALAQSSASRTSLPERELQVSSINLRATNSASVVP
eukprot:4803347-Pyramimonas_sp.AAC.1